MFAILPAEMSSKYMRDKEIEDAPILQLMPGPWGPAIARLRLARGLSQKAVAKRAKMTPTTYGRIEKGQHTQTRKLQNIAEVFSVDITEVLMPPHSALPQDDRTLDAIVARVRASIASTPQPDYDHTMRDLHQSARNKEQERRQGASDRRKLGRKK